MDKEDFKEWFAKEFAQEVLALLGGTTNGK